MFTVIPYKLLYHVYFSFPRLSIRKFAVKLFSTSHDQTQLNGYCLREIRNFKTILKNRRGINIWQGANVYSLLPCFSSIFRMKVREGL